MFVVYHDDGSIVGCYKTRDVADHLGCHCIEHPPVDRETHIVVDGAVVAKDARQVAAEREARDLKLARLRMIQHRNHLLQKSDWTQAPDAPVDREAWAAYRQRLRDLPECNPDPRNVEWPRPPRKPIK